MCRLKRVLSLAGATGRVRTEDDPILKQWGKHLDTDWARERVQIGNCAENVCRLYGAYARIHEECKLIPSQILLICVNPWGDTPYSMDELIAPQEALDIILSLGRGTLIIDKTQRGTLGGGQLAHDMGALKTEVLMKLVDSSLALPRQILCLDSLGLS